MWGGHWGIRKEKDVDLANLVRRSDCTGRKTGEAINMLGPQGLSAEDLIGKSPKLLGLKAFG